jgi:hypothetical protein
MIKREFEEKERIKNYYYSFFYFFVNKFIFKIQIASADLSSAARMKRNAVNCLRLLCFSDEFLISKVSHLFSQLQKYSHNLVGFLASMFSSKHNNLRFLFSLLLHNQKKEVMLLHIPTYFLLSSSIIRECGALSDSTYEQLMLNAKVQNFLTAILEVRRVCSYIQVSLILSLLLFILFYFTFQSFFQSLSYIPSFLYLSLFLPQERIIISLLGSSFYIERLAIVGYASSESGMWANDTIVEFTS